MQNLPFQTPTQIAALVLTLLAGWLFGLAGRSGGRKWRERYLDEKRAHAASRERVDAALAEAQQRIRTLEAENARLSHAAPAAIEGTR
ncbi:hypothetical protein ACG3SL_02680 [Sphingomonas sp. CJ20]